MNGWLIGMLINMLFTLLMSGVKTIDWGAFLAKATTFVNQFLPTFFQPAVDGIIAGAVAALQAALADAADLQKIKDDLLAGNWNQALADLQALLANVEHPAAPTVAWAAGHVGLGDVPKAPAAAASSAGGGDAGGPAAKEA